MAEAQGERLPGREVAQNGKRAVFPWNGTFAVFFIVALQKQEPRLCIRSNKCTTQPPIDKPTGRL